MDKEGEMHSIHPKRRKRAQCRSILAWSALCSVLLMLGCWSCSLGMRTQYARLSLRFELPRGYPRSRFELETMSGGKAILPERDWNISAYRLTCSPDTGSPVIKTLTQTASELRLSPGTWNIRVEGLSKEGSLILEQSVDAYLEPGKTTEVLLSLHLAEGEGSLRLALSTSTAVPSGWFYRIDISFRGIPGRPNPAYSDMPYPISAEIPATETEYALSGLKSGSYSTTVKLVDQSGNVIGGAADLLLILPGQTSSGSCRIVVGEPAVHLDISVPKVAATGQAVIAASRYLNRNYPLVVPLALPPSLGNATVAWYRDGASAGNDMVSSEEALAGFLLKTGLFDADPALLHCHVDALIPLDEGTWADACGHDSSLLSYSGSGLLEWIQKYDYHAALSPSLHRMQRPSDNGTGQPADVKWISKSQNGLVAVAGLDKASAVHLFFYPFGIGIGPAPGSSSPEPAGISGTTLPEETAWLRLWRDTIVINGDERSPDRLALSPDGSLLAAAASTSNWIRLYRLGPSGNILSSLDLVSGSGGPWIFSNIRAMKFSKDGHTLFVLANSPEKILMFDLAGLAEGQIGYGGEQVLKALWENPPSSSLVMEDLEILDNGWIAACSSGIGRLFFLHHDGACFDASQIIASGAQGESLGSPKAIEYCSDGSGNGMIYVLGSARKLHAFRHNGDSFEALMSLSLPVELDKARSLALIESAETNTISLITVGSTHMGVVGLDSEGLMGQILCIAGADEATSDIPQIVCAEALGSALVTAGGSSGTVSVYKAK